MAHASDEFVRLAESAIEAAHAFRDAARRGDRDEALRHKRRASLALDLAALEMWREEAAQ